MSKPLGFQILISPTSPEPDFAFLRLIPIGYRAAGYGSTWASPGSPQVGL
ncbi:MAG: hypothetical protein QXO15_08955 [Nitrososphaerota archaeon]